MTRRKRSWWRTSGLKLLREQDDREFYGFGRGRIVAYKDAVFDPSSFASDVVDLITPERRTGAHLGRPLGHRPGHGGSCRRRQGR